MTENSSAHRKSVRNDRIENALAVLKSYKDNPRDRRYRIRADDPEGGESFYLECVSGTDEEVTLLTEWRERYQDAFPTQFTVTREGTERWVKKALMDIPGRILFMVRRLPTGEAVGHLGLANVGEEKFGFKNSCEIDNVIRGRFVAPKAMELGLLSLCRFCIDTLEMTTIYLRVFADNGRAVRFYQKWHFREERKIPLKRREEAGKIVFEEIDDKSPAKPDRYFSLMKWEGHL